MSAAPDRKVSLHLHCHHDTGRAYKFSTDGVDEHAAFVPHDAVIVTAKAGMGLLWQVEISLKLAQQKGLIAEAGKGQGSLF